VPRKWGGKESETKHGHGRNQRRGAKDVQGFRDVFKLRLRRVQIEVVHTMHIVKWPFEEEHDEVNDHHHHLTIMSLCHKW
jgi:hypothetical protein